LNARGSLRKLGPWKTATTIVGSGGSRFVLGQLLFGPSPSLSHASPPWL
jgi:hypothetical protein